ncbi:hypothetical protein [Paracidovorax sp. MALMAid1276]|uniref:hypothetical protein n=1 Tax=Paracidovorax sp. MALMAid1276 TaxID=3411631 RepID=UPI003B9B1290
MRQCTKHGSFGILGNCKCSDINGLYYENGDIAVLDCGVNAVAFGSVIKRLNIRDVSVDEVGLVDFDYVGGRLFDGLIAKFGEGSSGGDGVLCLLSQTTKKMLWFLFLDNGNPFCDEELFGDDIHLRSTNGAVFSIPVHRPQFIRVIKASEF